MIQDELPKAAQRRLDAFRRAADRFCRVIERSNRNSDIDLFRRLSLSLGDVLTTGQRLPVVDPWADEPDDDDEEATLRDEHEVGGASVLKLDADEPGYKAHMEAYREAHRLLDSRTTGRNFHRLVFDPYSPDPSQRAEMTASLSDHFAQIYAGIKEHFLLDSETGTTAEPPYLRAWHWKFVFDAHWVVYHVLPALTALTFLLNRYWDDEDGWYEVWQPEPDACEVPNSDGSDP